MKFTKIMRAKGKITECIRCLKCGDIVHFCDKCGQDLVIECGCDYDFICDGYEHICQECENNLKQEKEE